MFTRISELSIRPDKREEFLSLIHNELVNMLQKQSGFVDVTLLVSDTDQTRAVAQSFWKSKDDAERFYNGPTFASFLNKGRALLQSDPRVHTYTVDTSTFHHIARGKAA